MNAVAGTAANLPNEVPIIGLRVESLRPFMANDRTPISIADLQTALCLDRRSAKRAADLLVRVGYLLDRHTKPGRYMLTRTALKALEPPSGASISRADALEVVGDLMRVVGAGNKPPEGSRISAVTLFGAVLDGGVEDLPFVEAQVTVNVLPPSERAGIQLRRIEKALRRVHRSLHVSLVLDST